MSDKPATSHAGLGVGGIIGDSFSIVFGNFLTCFVIILIPTLLIVAVFAAIGASIYLSVSQTLADPATLLAQNLSGSIALAMVVLLIVLMVYGFIYAGLTRVVYDVKSGAGASIGRALASGLGRAVPLMVVMTLVSIVVGLATVPVSLLMAGVSQLGAAGTMIGIVLGLALFVCLLYASACLISVVPAIVVENLWFSAIPRSFSLSSGYRWPLVGLLVLFFLILLGVGLVITLVQGVFLLSGPIVGSVLGSIFSMFSSTLTLGLAAALIALAYARLRNIKEGIDVKQIAAIFD